MAGWHIGVIGGSGLYALEELEDAQTIPVGSAFGEPSSPVTLGRIGDVRFSFIARHGEGHVLSPASTR
jgi:5'-methylthioadenosine phosphorylase